MLAGESVELIIKKRAVEPLGGGEITLSIPNIKQLKPVQVNRHIFCTKIHIIFIYMILSNAVVGLR